LKGSKGKNMAFSRLSPDPNSTLRLSDGRRLGYREVGKSDGFPIFHFHGNGSSRLEILVVQSKAERSGVRLIGLDRPGIGCSDPMPGYRLLDWPDDVLEVANQLGIEQFAVEGLSGGGPYALACAYKIPHRLTGCGLIAPATGPFITKAGRLRLRMAVWMLAHHPWLIRALVRLRSGRRRSDEASIEKRLLRTGARLGAADHKLLGTSEIRTAFAQAITESARQGGDASTRDGMIFAGPWGFRPEEVVFGNVFLWQGEQDQIMEVSAARQFAQALPQCTATFYAHEGHLSTFVNHTQDIWEALGMASESE
jgi:pimeloyl-ACP methyl ester carboxylesterase